VSPLAPRRADLAALAGYHSPQVDARVRLNTNESPLPPPAEWQEELAAEVRRLEFNRYPDREAVALREALAEYHGVDRDEIFCANGSNEALQSLLLAFGGPGRQAALFEPTYQLHSHIARITLTGVVAGTRRPDLLIDPAEVDRLLGGCDPEITFLCSPNNPSGRIDPPDLVRHVLSRAPGLVVVDEAYGQFAPWSALELRTTSPAPEARGLVVVRTFSKTWAMAAARLGYLVADPEVVAGCEAATLPYHLSAVTQVAGRLALRYRSEMEARVASVAEERGRIAAALGALAVEAWPSDANFVLFRPLEREAKDVWHALLARGVLIRDCSEWEGLPGCLRVTVGTPGENDAFLDALEESLR
jgi:histidinol-phosphate aminotransferase